MAKIKILIFVFITIGYSLLPGASYAQDTGWDITNFHSDITLNPDTTVRVVERLDVDFKNLDKHGIFRSIPVKYQTKLGTNLNIRLKVNSIHDNQGNSYQYSSSRTGSLLKLQIGDPDTTVTGKNTYIIDYTVSDVLTHPNEQAEFYWNVTGNDWPVEILASSVTITGPQESLHDSICFTGHFGSQFQDCVTLKQANSIKAGSNLILGPGEGFTVAVSLDSSRFTFPTPTQKLLRSLADNWPLVIPFFTLLVMFRLYWLYGRDRQYKNIFHETGEIHTVPLFEKLNPMTTYGPLKSILPGEAGTIVDETVHMQDITATIIDLARRGHISIKEIPAKGLFSKPDFLFTYIEKEENTLVPFEIHTLNLLFNSRRERTPILISDLKKHTDTQKAFSDVKNGLYNHVVKQGYFYSSPETARLGWLMGGFLILVLGVAVPVNMSYFINSLPWIIAGTISGIIILIFSPFMASRSAKGRKLLAEIVGLKEWISIGAWRERIHEKHNFFEEILPFAIAFGLTDKFIKAFSEAELKEYSKGMPWYHGSSTHFSNSFTNLSSTINSSVVSVSSASRGGSGFSGGSSGGGFGGGGGGSW